MISLKTVQDEGYSIQKYKMRDRDQWTSSRRGWIWNCSYLQKKLDDAQKKRPKQNDVQHKKKIQIMKQTIVKSIVMEATNWDITKLNVP